MTPAPKHDAGWPVFWYSGQTPPWWARGLERVYCAVQAIKRWSYRRGWRRSARLAVPVVIVGNRVVGGAGKTPLLMALTQHLQQQGLRVGIISRGYGRQTAEVCAVTRDSTSEQVGDEPRMLFQQLAVPVYVGARRVAAAEALLAAHSVDVLLSDDGWQHWALPRDYVIEVIDADKGYGNGHALPAGPLREKQAMYPPNLRLYNGRDFTLSPSCWLHIATGARYPLVHLQGQVNAMAGIGNPARFFVTLRQLHLELNHQQALADHQKLDFAAIARWDDAKIPLVMTLKDAMRCTENIPDHWWALCVDTHIDAQHFAELTSLLQQKAMQAKSVNDT